MNPIDVRPHSYATMSESSPQKVTSKQIGLNVSIEPALRSKQARSQKDLKETMEQEIGDQAFTFPSEELARILSPKRLKRSEYPPEDLLPLSEYDCTVDEPAFKDALEDVLNKLRPFPKPPVSDERSCYPDLVKFLNNCVRLCHDSLDKQEGQKFIPKRLERCYCDLEFVVAKAVEEGVEGSRSLKPDITGRLGGSELDGKRLRWKPPADEPANGIVLPLEVKNSWNDLVPQAATYARGMFSQRPMQMFALVLAFNHIANEFRFLVFHRGGLAASVRLLIGKRDDRKGKEKGEEYLEGFARLFLTLALWTTAADTGIVPCGNDTTYLLPTDEDGEESMPLTVEKILFQSLCVRGRMTHVLLLRHQTQADLQPQEEQLKPDVQVAGSFGRFEMIARQDPKPQPLPGRPVRIRKTVQKYSAMGGGSHDPTKATTSTKPTSEKIAGQEPKPQPLPGRPVRIRKTVQRYSAMGGGSHDPTKATTSTKPTSEKIVPPPGRRSSICDLGVS